MRRNTNVNMLKLGIIGRIRKFFWSFYPTLLYYGDCFKETFPNCDIEIWNLVRSLSTADLPESKKNINNLRLIIGCVAVCFDNDGDLEHVEVRTHNVYVSKATRKYITVKVNKLINQKLREENEKISRGLKMDVQSSFIESKGL